MQILLIKRYICLKI